MQEVNERLKVMLAAFIITLCVSFMCRLVYGQDPNDDDYTVIKYNPKTVPPLYQSIIPFGGGSYWWPKLRWHGPGNVGQASNPNLLHPWRFPAGTGRVNNLRMLRTLYVPRGQYIHAWKTTDHVAAGTISNGRFISGQPRPVWRWRFPVDTHIAENLYDDDGLFARRLRKKVSMDPSDEWEPFEEILREPPGYVQETRSCFSCHKDAGKETQQLAGDFPGREWYGHLRGDDQVFSVRPVRTDGSIHPTFQAVVKLVDNERQATTLMADS